MTFEGYDRSHDRSHDKKSMATSLFSRNKMGTKTNEPIDYDGIKPTEQINAVKIPCVNEGYEKCNVEKWNLCISVFAISLLIVLLRGRALS
jgi:hypothetical protein